MKWQTAGQTAIETEDGRCTISRSPQEGHVTDERVCYTLTIKGRYTATIWCADNEQRRNDVVRTLKRLCDA